MVVAGTTVALLLLLEAGVRISRPDVNAQDTERKLLKDKAFGNSYGWAPNTRGLSFGVEVSIDESGFRRISPPKNTGDVWLLLGDSVTFGVGVAEQQIFPQLLQDHLAAVRVWNSAVTGYSVLNYRDVVLHVLQTRHKDLGRVILFYTLNDLYGNLELARRDSGIVDRMLGFLRRHSRLYVLVKDLATDRSKSYFMHDYALYAEDRPEWVQATKILGELGATLHRYRIPFDVVILPYEYQLRTGGGELLRPQRMLVHALHSNNINVIDLYDDFASRKHASGEYFLYGDPMHLSILGHRVVYDALMTHLQK